MSTPQEITDQTVATSLIGTDYIIGIDRSDTTQGADGSMCLITRDNLGLGLSIAASQVTSGTLADARIAESNVTQHQAALSITESQISDLGSYAPLSGADFTGQCTVATGSGVPLLVKGWGPDSAGNDGGAIQMGEESAFHGMISYDNSGSILYIDNAYNSASGDIRFRTKTAGTALTPLCVEGNGNIGVMTTAPLATLDVNGTFRVRSLPTSDPAQAGEFWNDSGTVKVSAG